MRRKQIEIKTVSYVHVGNDLVNTEDLNAEQKRKLGTWIRHTYFSNLYAGQATFYPVEEK